MDITIRALRCCTAYARGKVFLSSVLPGETRLQKKTVVAAVDVRTGKPVWVLPDQSAQLHDQILAFDANTGKIRWRFHTSGPVKMSRVVMNGRVYAGDTVGML